jgi:hypothetical protein
MAISISDPKIVRRTRVDPDTGNTSDYYCICVEITNTGENPERVSVDFQGTYRTPHGVPGRGVTFCEDMEREVPGKRVINIGGSSAEVAGYLEVCCCDIDMATVIDIQNFQGWLTVFVTELQNGTVHRKEVERFQPAPRSRPREVSRSEKVRFGAWLGAQEKQEFEIGGALNIPKGWDVQFETSRASNMNLIRVRGILSVGKKAQSGEVAYVLLQSLIPQRNVPDQVAEEVLFVFEVKGGSSLRKGKMRKRSR